MWRGYGLWQYYLHNALDNEEIGWHECEGKAASDMERDCAFFVKARVSVSTQDTCCMCMYIGGLHVHRAIA